MPSPRFQQFRPAVCRGLIYWLYEVPENQRLVPDKKVGQALIFTKATLDRHSQEIRHKDGQPG